VVPLVWRDIEEGCTKGQSQSNINVEHDWRTRYLATKMILFSLVKVGHVLETAGILCDERCSFEERDAILKTVLLTEGGHPREQFRPRDTFERVLDSRKAMNY
jgi:hypothetical protein